MIRSWGLIKGKFDIGLVQPSQPSKKHQREDVAANECPDDAGRRPSSLILVFLLEPILEGLRPENPFLLFGETDVHHFRRRGKRVRFLTDAQPAPNR